MPVDLSPDFFNRPLAEVDPEIADVLAHELERQQRTLEMIASENFVPQAVLDCQGSVLTNKYAEGYIGRRYYGGCEWVDVSEGLRSSAPSRSSAATTSTCSRTRARRPTAPPTSRSWSRGTRCWGWSS